MNKSLTLFLLLLFALGVTPSSTQAAPPPQIGGTQVTIQNPVNGMTFQTGQTIGVASNSTAAGGIAFVQLFVDNVAITTSSPPNGFPVSPFFVIQYWTTNPGYHTITVKATSSQGVPGQASIFINVGGGGPPTGPTNTPNPCVVGSRLLGDANYPPGSQIQPGTRFQKTWQVQNTGSCIWISGYGNLNISGGSFGASSPSNIPYTQPGQTVNVSVNMLAPQQPGPYRSVWQLRATNGALFGTQMVAQFNVPQAGCSGAPQISSFYASPQTVFSGQSSTLVWGPINNADQVRLQTPLGSSSVPAQGGQLNIFPQTTTSYILTAFCRGQRVDAAATINVTNPPPPTPTPPPFQQNSIFLQQAQSAGFGAINVPVQYFYNNQNAPGQIQLTAYNRFGQIVGNSAVGAIPYSQQFTTITISIPTGYRDAVNIQGCLVDRTGTPLTCGSGLGAR